MTEIEKLASWCSEKNNCLAVEKECHGCPFESSSHCIRDVRDAITSLVSVHLPVKPSRGNDDDYYCGKCGAKISFAIKVYDGERYMTSHPDHLKPANKWQYCKCCGQAVKWE